jgi:hypothetical protein
LNLLDGQFNVPPGALLSHSCRKKLKEGMDGAASEKHALWCKVIEGRNDMAIDIAVYSAKMVMLGPATPSMRCDIQLEVDQAARSMSVASIKSQLRHKHGINWNDAATGYTLCRVHDEHASARLEDDGQEIEVGTLMMMCPANPEQLLQLPRVVFDEWFLFSAFVSPLLSPFMAIDGQSYVTCPSNRWTNDVTFPARLHGQSYVTLSI